MYAQKNYLEIMGINGKYRISQIGCFLTAFSNLSTRFGRDISPVQLNAAFRDRNLYRDVDDGIRDDLGYYYMTKYDSDIVVTGEGKGAPTTNDAIVKFYFKGNSGFNTHFCLVHDASKGQIVDSWDGKIKSWNVYGGPITWASYGFNGAVAAPTPALPVSDATSITVQKGWGLSHVAKAAGFADYSSPERWNAIARLNGHKDASTFRLYPDQRIVVKSDQPVEKPVEKPVTDGNTVLVQKGWGISHVAKAAGYADYKERSRWNMIAKLNGHNDATTFKLQPNQSVKVKGDLPTPTPVPVAIPVPEPAKAEPVENIAPLVVDWKETYQEKPAVYNAKQDAVIKDLAGIKADIQLIDKVRVNGAGVFVKDGTTYIRTRKSVEGGFWYGIPEDFLTPPEDPDKYVGPLLSVDEDDDELFNLDMTMEEKQAFHSLSIRERVVALVAWIQGFLLRGSSILRRNKK